jgi:hypothetical protein
LDALPFTDEGCGNLIETLEYAKLKGMFRLAYAMRPSPTSPLQALPLALPPLLTSLSYGQLSVSHVHLHIVGLITDRLILAGHYSSNHFGEDCRLLPSEQSDE